MIIQAKPLSRSSAKSACMTGHSLLLQRKCACGNPASSSLDGECEACVQKRLQRLAIRQSSGLVVPAEVDQVLRSSGRVLDLVTLHTMQQRLGHNFEHVRIHDDTSAAASAAAVNSAIERARAACREVPVVSAEFGVRGQLIRPESGESAPTYLSGSATFHF